MADLEQLGLSCPHASAAACRPQIGLRMFVDGLLEIGDLSDDDRRDMDARVAGTGQGPGRCAHPGQPPCYPACPAVPDWLVAPKLEAPLKHVEFVALGPGRALVVLVTEMVNGHR